MTKRPRTVGDLLNKEWREAFADYEADVDVCARVYSVSLRSKVGQKMGTAIKATNVLRSLTRKDELARMEFTRETANLVLDWFFDA